MYAVVVTGGKQYRVMQGERLRVELLDLEVGKDVMSVRLTVDGLRTMLKDVEIEPA